MRRDHVREAAFQGQRQLFGKLSYLPAELICVLVVISMKINQQEAQLPLGIIQCLGIRAEEVKLQGLWARGKQHPQGLCDPGHYSATRVVLVKQQWRMNLSDLNKPLFKRAAMVFFHILSGCGFGEH